MEALTVSSIVFKLTLTNLSHNSVKKKVFDDVDDSTASKWWGGNRDGKQEHNQWNSEAVFLEVWLILPKTQSNFWFQV